MKLPLTILLGGVMGLQTQIFGQTLTISGRVLDSATSHPIANAAVSLKNLKHLGISTYTDVEGRFALVYTPTKVQPAEAHSGSTCMRLTGGIISFSTAANELVRIDLYDIGGRKECQLLNRRFNAGAHSISLSALARKGIGAGLYAMKITKGREDFTGTLLALGAKNPAAVHGTGSADGRNAWVIAPRASSYSLDSLPVYRMGYLPTALPISSYTTQNVGDIKLSQTAEEKAIAKKVDSILALMSTNEKAGQMTMARKGELTDAQIASLGIGSVFNGGGDPEGNNTPTAWAGMIDRIQGVATSLSPRKIPIIYGQDCVHGVGSITGTTVFPHNIGLGCTGDTALVAKIGAVTASEASGCGIRLNFAPCVASVRNEKWGRSYEGFGETPEINSLMGVAYVRGQQGYGDPSKDTAIAVSVKHYLADGGTTNGVNSGVASLSDQTMREVHFPQYLACARENMGTIMPSYSTWARPGGLSFKMTLDSIAYRMIKKEGGWDGVTVSDWDAVPLASGVSVYDNNCVAKCVNAGLDMAMIVSNANTMNWINAIVSQAGSVIPMSRIDDAVRRILRLKLRMHLFDHPKSSAIARAQINSPAHQAIAREAVRKSLVLLKNTGNALPLTKNDRITVVGPFADNMGIQCGGWTISWQGQSGNPNNQIAGQTILAGMQSVGNTTNITYNSSGTGLVAANIDKIVVVVGESPYAESQGDNLNNLDLTNTNNAGSLITACHNTGKPVIVILLSGRPLIIGDEIDKCAAFVAAWLPGNQGAGVADVLYGDFKFTGKLTHTWPASYNQIPINTGKTYADEQKGGGGTPLYPYGHGLSY